MHFRLSIQAALFLFLVIILTGCSLPMNDAKKQAPISIHAKHWLNGSNVDEQMAQGLTAYLALDDAFISIASRLY